MNHSKIWLLGFCSLFLMACNDTTFDYVNRACEAPADAARFGMNEGPVIMSPVERSAVPGTVNLAGSCVSGTPVTVQEVNFASTVVNCVNSQFTASLALSSGEGTKDIMVTQATGHDGAAVSDRLCFSKDTTAPFVAITPLNTTQSVSSGSSPVSGKCESGLPVIITGPGLAQPVTLNCVDGGFSGTLNLTNGDGTKRLVATQFDPVGNQGTAFSNYHVDSTAPDVRITAPNALTVTRGTLTVQGSCENGLRVGLGDVGTSNVLFTNCVNGAFSTDVTLPGTDGTKTVHAFQVDEAGNIGRSNRDYIKDTTPPSLTIETPAAQSFISGTPTFTGTCESGLAVALSGSVLANPVTVNCSQGQWTYTGAVASVQGVQELVAVQTDAVANSTRVTRSFQVDGSAPQLAYLSPVANSFVSAAFIITGTCETNLTVTVDGAGLLAPVQVPCVNGSFTANVNATALDGTKATRIRQTDAAGNTGTAQRDFQRDSLPPVLTITNPPAGSYVSSSVTLVGTCEAGLTLSFSGAGLSSPSTATCGVNGQYNVTLQLSPVDGTKSVQISETDVAGNTTQVSRDFVRDTLAPVVTITGPAAQTNTSGPLTLTGTCETGLQVAITGAVAATSTACTNGQFTVNVTLTGSDGPKTVTAAQTDPAGNVGTTSQNYVLDQTPPTLTITSPAALSFVAATFVLQGQCQTGLNVVISGAGIMAGGSVPCNGGSYSTTLTTSNGDGTKNVIATQTDASNNTATAQRDFRRDTTAPVLTITSPVNGSLVGSTFNLTGTCEAGLVLQISGTGVSSPTQTTCTPGGTYSVTLTPSAGDGPKAVDVSVTDPAGNANQVTGAFVRDTTPPAVAITGPAANSVTSGALTLVGTCETGLNVVISSAALAAPVTTPCTSGQFSSNLSLTGVDGNKTLTATQTDVAGNVGQDQRTFIKDAQPGAPVITITSPANNSQVPINATIAGACETGLTVTITGDLTTATGACASGAYSIAVSFTAGLGLKNVIARQTDAVGNVGQATAQYNRATNGNVENFVTDASFGKIDILFVDDNSASMDPQQASLGTKFSGFSSELQNIDWQIGITTTDCSAGPYGICGSLLTLSGINSKILTPSVANYATVFNNNIQRPETAGCLNTGTCPAGNSEPLLAATTAINKRSTNNAGFFRGNADLAIVILSDADEGQTGPASANGRPAALIQAFSDAFGTSKKLSVYGIIVKPTDTACYNQLNAANGGFSFYGNLLNQTVTQTQGLAVSICAPDYTTTLRSIGESVRTLSNSVQLAHVPVAGTVQVTLNPVQNITYKVIGDKVVFDSPPAPNTQVTVTYEY